MSSRLLSVADAAVTELNAITLSQTFTAERVLVFEVRRKDLEESDPPLVLVRGLSIEPKRQTRGKVSSKIVVEICVMKGLSDVTAAVVDPFVAFVEEIADHFESVRLANRSNAVVESAIAKPPYDEEHLAKFKQFTGLVTLQITDWT